ncbi:CPA1 family monovalent cation:H+ antiporter [Amylocarpus encephaloides]|uniref:CPA1 family monovalent cation:H+ antiporter n=1 Tax=Amylocarpus encephaloides TaxID=45428 RepID=A0A9P7YGX7_9HELO|nr:CPA1 family monovalent cation:H+ antiporter [Amylocarpus encephaloides]
MPTLSITNFNIVCSVLGGFITLFGLVSYLCKEKFYLSEALISLVVGVIFSPRATNLVKPLEYTGTQENLDLVTLYFTRLVLGVQLVLAGVQLPSRYLKTEWKSLALLLGPIMTTMWLASSLLVWAMVPHLPFLHALAVGACVTPTDPILSNGIVKGKFADKNIPKDLQKIITAESGSNDGLGYPFLFLALYLIRYTGEGGTGQHGGAGHAIGLWFGETWAYTILLSVAYGFAVGWIAKELLHWAEERKFVDRESFLVFAITLALFIVGTCGMFGSDDVLACFVAGNAFTWDDWFRLETLDDSLQPTIDMLLNLSIFMWFGAVCPWQMFLTNNVIPIYRLIPLGIMVLLFRRLPVVFAFHKKIHQIEDVRQAIFMGFFGPIGVSAIFYLYISLEFLVTIKLNDHERTDAEHLGEVMTVVIWFLVICSIVVHGLSIPLGKLGFFLPRTLSRAFTAQNNSEGESFSTNDGIIPGIVAGVTRERIRGSQSRQNTSRTFVGGITTPLPIYEIGGTVVKDPNLDGGVPSPVQLALGKPPTSPPPAAQAPEGKIKFPDETGALPPSSEGSGVRTPRERAE